MPRSSTSAPGSTSGTGRRRHDISCRPESVARPRSSGDTRLCGHRRRTVRSRRWLGSMIWARTPGGPERHLRAVHFVGALSLTTKRGNRGQKTGGHDPPRYARSLSRVFRRSFPLKGEEVTLVLGSGAVVVVSLGAVVGAVTLIVKAIQAAPGWLLAILGIGLGVALLHPTRRERILGFLSDAGRSLGKVGLGVLEVLAEANERQSEVAVLAEAARVEFEAKYPGRTRQPLRSVVLGVLARADEPLTVPEIEERVQLAGYRPRGRDPWPMSAPPPWRRTRR